jgi:dipeptidyl aminopeptidase/acylaminoacyl peptidase
MTPIRGGFVKKMRGFLVILGLCALVTSAHAATMDPKIKWFTIKTPHFKVHFPENNEATARQVAAYAEEAYETVGAKFKWHPKGKTNVVVTDHHDEANGLASVLPYKYMNIRVTSPDPDQSLHLYDNWLRTLVMHEYTHIIHLSQYGGVVTPLRYLMGSTISMNGSTPGWVREGIATVQETQHTDGGRGRSAYSDMILRAAILQNQFPAIDQVSGPGWAWPGSEGQYIYGVKFLQYLRDKYGEDKLMEFSERMSKTIMPFSVNMQAKRVWKKSFYTLWKEWQASLKPQVKQVADDLMAKGLTELVPVTKLGKDTTITAVAYSPDGAHVAYAMSSPHENATIKLLNLETGKHETLVKKFVATQLSFSPDSAGLYFSATSLHKRYYLFRDLFYVDLATKKRIKVTGGLRAQDPDMGPDGKSVVMSTNSDGTKQLVVFDTETRKLITLPINAPQYTHYAHPRWSPDGKMIAVSVWREGSRDIYIYDAKGKVLRQLTDDDAIDSEVAWSKDSKSIYFSSDRSGVSNIYMADVKTGAMRQLSNVLTGVFSPTLAPDGSRMVVKYYTGKGYELMSMAMPNNKNLPPVIKETVTRAPASDGAADVLPEVAPITDPQKKYTPFGNAFLLPHYISPFFTTLDDGVLFGIITGSSDPLNRHSWQAGANYRTDTQHVGYSASYSYSRWRPQFSLSYTDYSVTLGPLTFVTGGVASTKNIYEARRRAAATVAYPLTNKQSVALMYGFEHRESISRPALTTAEDSLLNFGRFAGPSLFYVYSDTETTKAAISTERGQRVRALLTLNEKVFGTLGDNVQRIFSGDLRKYFSMPWLHHVVAFRTAGGIAFGQQLVQGTFTLGGSLGEGALSAGGESMFYFPLRGLPGPTFSRSRALLFSTEYRMPLIYAQRGLGTLPVFLNDLNLAFFADYGNAWNKNEGLGSTGFNNFMLGTGAELRADFVLGHGLPVTGRLGWGVVVVNNKRVKALSQVDPYTGTNIKNGAFILQFGTSF